MQLKQAVDELTDGLPSTSKLNSVAKKSTKPKEPRKKRESVPNDDAPRRQSRRLHPPVVNPETPETKRKRVAEEEENNAKDAEAQLEREMEEHQSKRARHDPLDFGGELPPAFDNDIPSPTRRVIHSGTERREIEDLRDKVKDLSLIAHNKVSQHRIYCAAYHRDVSKDLLFFGQSLCSSCL